MEEPIKKGLVGLIVGIIIAIIFEIFNYTLKFPLFGTGTIVSLIAGHDVFNIFKLTFNIESFNYLFMILRIVTISLAGFVLVGILFSKARNMPFSEWPTTLKITSSIYGLILITEFLLTFYAITHLI